MRYEKVGEGEGRGGRGEEVVVGWVSCLELVCGDGGGDGGGR